MICANGCISFAHQLRTPSAQLTAGALVGKAIAQRRANGHSSNRAPIAQLRAKCMGRVWGVSTAHGLVARDRLVGTCAKSQIKLSAISIRQGGYRYPFCAGKSDCKRNWAHAENLCGV